MALPMKSSTEAVAIELSTEEFWEKVKIYAEV